MVRALERAVALAAKDLRVEWRRREVLLPSASFGLLVALVLGLTQGAQPDRAPAVLWVALALAAVLLVARTTEREGEEGTLEALLLYPGSREDLFWGRWAALVVLLLVLGLALGLAQAVLFGVRFGPGWMRLVAAGLLASCGLAAVGALLSALLLNVRGGHLLMPLLLLPTCLPVLLAGIRLTEAALQGAPFGPWLGVLVVFDALFLLVGPPLFAAVAEG
jgi:heme exporter protein B